MDFDPLPNEVLYAIIDSLGTCCHININPLINASPRFFRLWKKLSEDRLLHGLQAHVHPDAMNHALAIINVPKRSTALQSLPQARQSFLTRYFDKSNPFPFPVDYLQMRTLAHINARIEAMWKAYAKATLCNETNHTGPLSWFEVARLQRAFFRHELYCRVFSRGPDGRSIMGANDQFDLFVSRLAPWEAEEMACVHDFYTWHVRRMVEIMEDDVVNAVLLASAGVSPSMMPQDMAALHAPFAVVSFAEAAEAFAALPPGTTHNLDGDGFTPGPQGEAPGQGGRARPNVPRAGGMHETALYPFSTAEKHRSAQHLSYLAALGVYFVHELLTADKDVRRQTLQAYFGSARDFFPEALECAPKEACLTVIPPDVHEEHPSKPTMGYFKFKQSDYDTYLRISGDGYLSGLLRKRGYVFWDVGRINEETLDECLVGARNLAPEIARHGFDPSRRICAEERLGDVSLSRTQLRRIERDFGARIRRQ
ncbi:hypothetical protein HIM_04666 [Hirsutella minnesotensis 3608]|uniref:Uncharacterized protein n=1 Tax=Hirsutella minnesotensis 3608 TaxID=1043627 RepID=A0A0F8A139_9HYPO|nr:hypothetical protein HIM_04666 [Hirsutella minnesotensis 3608]